MGYRTRRREKRGVKTGQNVSESALGFLTLNKDGRSHKCRLLFPPLSSSIFQSSPQKSVCRGVLSLVLCSLTDLAMVEFCDDCVRSLPSTPIRFLVLGVWLKNLRKRTCRDLFNDSSDHFGTISGKIKGSSISFCCYGDFTRQLKWSPSLFVVLSM